MKAITMILTMSVAVAMVLPATTAQQSAASANPPAAAAPCSSAQHGALDFWLGDWDVTNAAGVTSGASHVERILGGCVVMEHWTSVRGGYEGKSFNTFDSVSGRWTQHWVDNGGLSAEMTGEFEGSSLVYRRSFVKRDGAAVTTRMTFFSLAAGRVRQLVEQSVDGGKSWTTQFDLRYTRRRT